MGRVSSHRKTAAVLRKTLAELEADPTIDTQDPAFINLKCTLLNRILELETGKARVEAVIHLVDAVEAEASESATKTGENSKEKGDDSAIA